MSIEGHLTRLIKEHKELDEKIKRLVAHPSYDTIELHELKKQKLSVKDRIDILYRTNPLVQNISGDTH